ncbi:hypothetical protein VUR80DRAFT_2455 [Thermomyces stellatus]
MSQSSRPVKGVPEIPVAWLSQHWNVCICTSERGKCRVYYKMRWLSRYPRQSASNIKPVQRKRTESQFQPAHSASSFWMSLVSLYYRLLTSPGPYWRQ